MLWPVIAGMFLVWCASPAAGEALGFEACLARAEAGNPDVRKARDNAAAARERSAQAYAFFFPSLSANALYTRISESPPVIDLASFARPGSPLPQITGNPLLQYVGTDNYNAFFQVRQPLYAGGRIRGTWAAAGAEQRAQEANLAAARQKLRVDMVRAFYGVIVARDMLTLSREARQQLKLHLDRVDRFLQSGMATEYDFLKSKVQYLTWAPKVAAAERELKSAVRRLNLLMGLSPDAPTEVTGVLAYRAGNQIPDPAPARERARRDRPELVAARALREAAGGMETVRRSPLFPQLNLQYNYNFLNQKDYFSLESTGWKTWWDLRLVFAWELFTAGRNRAALAEQRFRVHQAQVDLDSLASRIDAEVADACERLAETEKAVDLWKENVELAQRGYDIALDKYNNGRMTNVDVLDSQVALVDARVQYLKALYDYLVAQTELERAAAIEKSE